MPTPYPEYDETTNTLVMVDYWSVGEVAAMFHMSGATVRRRVRAEGWDVFHPLPGVIMFSAKQVAEAKATMTGPITNGHHPDIPEGKAPRLGVPVDPTDLETFRAPTPDPEDEAAEDD